MAQDQVIVPAENSVLCEGCGYTLDGLPDTGQCPECGLPIAQSLAESGRVVPTWERHEGNVFKRFWQTTGEIILHPTHFYRSLATRREDLAAHRFAKIHWAISAFLLAAAVVVHVAWLAQGVATIHSLPIFALAFAGLYVFFTLVQHFAGRLTAWEAGYRGIRLPLSVVRRGLYYHAAHLLPCSLLGLLTIGLNSALLRLRLIGEDRALQYIVVLCAEVIATATYLFLTYWIGMKNTMYANR